jgi:calmodulin
VTSIQLHCVGPNKNGKEDIIISFDRANNTLHHPFQSESILHSVAIESKENTMVAVSSDKVAQITDAFNQMASGGSVESKQLNKLFRAVGLNPTEAEVAEWKKEAGSSCDQDKFIAIATKKFEESDDSTDEIVDSFAVFDKDGEGFISEVEFKHILTTMGEALSEKELAEVLEEVEISDGQINYKAFADEIFSPEE